MKATLSATRCACWRLWVTITIAISERRPTIELLDHRGRHRVERRAGLVEEQDLGSHGKRASDAEALLLAAGECQRRMVEVVLDLLVEAGALQRLDHGRLEMGARGALRAALAQPVGDVVEDAHRERVGLLEEHPDAAPQVGDVEAGRRSSPSSRMFPPPAALSVRSTSRFSDRSSVVLPQPEGPISASTSPWRTGHRDLVDRELLAVGDAQLLGPHPLDGRWSPAARRAPAGCERGAYAALPSPFVPGAAPARRAGARR